MVAMLRIRVGRASVSARTDEWIDAGFNRATAGPWRRAGWDPAEAAVWHAASPGDAPHHLARLREDGYSADQLTHVGQRARNHIAAWTAATVGPASGGASDGATRAAAAHLVLSQLALDMPELDAPVGSATPDVVLDLRDRISSRAD